jgi:hypothetical protein
VTSSRASPTSDTRTRVGASVAERLADPAEVLGVLVTTDARLARAPGHQAEVEVLVA